MRAWLRRRAWLPARLLALALFAGAVLGRPGLPDFADPVWTQKGLLPVTLFGAVPNDAGDDTKAIQEALIAARDRGMTTYLPSGTYLISNTLKCQQRVVNNGQRWISERRKPCTLVGAGTGERSQLRLVPGAPGFDDPEHPKPLLWLWAQPPRGPHAGSDDPPRATPPSPSIR
jgi:hypothetical protein